MVEMEETKPGTETKKEEVREEASPEEKNFDLTKRIEDLDMDYNTLCVQKVTDPEMVTKIIRAKVDVTAAQIQLRHLQVAFINHNDAQKQKAMQMAMMAQQQAARAKGPKVTTGPLPKVKDQKAAAPIPGPGHAPIQDKKEEPRPETPVPQPQPRKKTEPKAETAPVK